MVFFLKERRPPGGFHEEATGAGLSREGPSAWGWPGQGRAGRTWGLAPAAGRGLVLGGRPRPGVECWGELALCRRVACGGRGQPRATLGHTKRLQREQGGHGHGREPVV